MPKQNLSLADLEALTGDYARVCTDLKTHLDRGEAECEAVRARYRPLLKRRAERCAVLKARLAAAIEAHPALFTQPRTRTWHGVRVGLRKLPGRVSSADEALTVRLIEKHYPEQAARAIKVTKRLVKDAVGDWSAQMLKRCGITLGEDTDTVFVKAVDGELDKQVAAWLDTPSQGGDT